jgi:hypothetical protein
LSPGFFGKHPAALMRPPGGEEPHTMRSRPID